MIKISYVEIEKKNGSDEERERLSHKMRVDSILLCLVGLRPILGLNNAGLMVGT
jgi:hypothetical protein